MDLPLQRASIGGGYARACIPFETSNNAKSTIPLTELVDACVRMLPVDALFDGSPELVR
jgi:hypothetical protein